MEFKILDKGFVKLIDCYGSDDRICEAARLSTQSTGKDNRTLIRYLIRHKHTSPLEFCEITFHLKLPIFVMRQLIRHRTANVNELSGRYSELETEFYVPEDSRILGKGKLNKQGSEGQVDQLYKATWLESLNRHFTDEESLYDMANTFGISNELARISLPLSIYTQCYWKIDLHNLLHFLELRLDNHAQYEIRVYAKAIAKVVKEHFPMVWEAFEDYRLNAVNFSEQELEYIISLIDFPKEWITEDDEEMKKRIPNQLERIEFINKLKGKDVSI